LHPEKLYIDALNSGKRGTPFQKLSAAVLARSGAGYMSRAADSAPVRVYDNYDIDKDEQDVYEQ
jgi:hypothetical protein